MRPAILALVLVAATAAVLAGSASAEQLATRPASIFQAPTATPPATGPRPADPPKTAPTDKGLPVVVRTALHVADIAAIDETEGTFTGTVDLRLRWEDTRLRFPRADVLGGLIDVRGDLAEARLAEIWTPEVALANLIDKPTYQVRRLRISPEGSVELLQRTSGQFTVSFDVQKFPFDRQELTVELVERREPLHRLTLVFRQDDVEFSRASDGVKIPGWRPGLLNLRSVPLPTWHGESQAQVRASLEVTRQSAKVVAGVFLPLLASLLIPLLALWLQRVEDGEIKIETFELSNILIGGLFAVIALNFTINSTYPALVEGDNTVNRLFGLNYLGLAVGLVINIVMFRFNLVGRLFGKHVLTRTFQFLTWGLPTVQLSTGAAIILLAMA